MGRRIEIGVLGPLSVAVDGREVHLPAKQRILLAVLTLDRRTVPADRLMIALWGDDVAPGAVRTLQSHVFQLRRALHGDVRMTGGGPSDVVMARPVIETDGRGYRLNVEPKAVDAGRFERLVADARAMIPEAPSQGKAMLAQAIGLWRGDVGPDVGGEPMATAELERLVELRDAAFDDLVRLRMTLGETAAVTPDLRRELRAHPYREPLWASLMRALDASGRKAEALLAYREATAALRAELDVEPDAELTALADRIRLAGRDTHEVRPSPVTAPAPVATNETAPVERRPRALAATVIAAVVAALLLSVRALPVGTSPGPAAASDGDAISLPPTADGVMALDEGGDVIGGTRVGARPGTITTGAGSMWVTSPTDGTVLRIDPETHDVIQRVSVGGSPAGIASGFDALWVADSANRSVARIDLATDQVVATIEVGTAPEGVATDARWVWVTDRLDHAVTRIDPRDGSTTSFALGASPVAIAVAAGWLWVADANGGAVVQMDPATGTVVRTIPVGSDPTAVAASPDGQALWVANSGSGTVFRIDTQTSTVTAAQAVGAAPTGVAVDDAAVWVAVSGTDEVVRLDPSTALIVGRTALAGSPRSVMSADGHVAVTTGAAAGSHRGGTLRVLTQAGDIADTADPTYAEWESVAIDVLTNDALVTYKRVGGPDGMTIVPDLATDIPAPTDGGRTWAFRLRPGLVYSDGKPVRASDVLTSFQRAVLAGNAAETGAGMFGDTEIVGSAACGASPPCDLGAGITLDDATGMVTFHLTMPDLDFPERIVGVPIVPADTPMARSTEPLPATGPYMVKAFDPGRSEHLVRNPRFVAWSQDAQPDGNPDEIDIEASDLADPTTAILAGEADILHLDSEPAARLAQLRTQVPGQLRVAPSDKTWFEVMNVHLAPFDDLRVREAVELATDREALVQAWGGPLVASVTCQVVPPSFAGYARYCPWTVDPSDNGNWLGPDVDRARSLIDAAGVRGMAVTVWGLDDGGQHARVARYFAGLLQELGFRATTHLLGFDQYFSFVSDHPDQAQVWGLWFSAEDRVASETIVGVFTCPSYPDPHQGRPGRWCDPALDIRIAAAVQLQTTDGVAADEAWADIDRTIVDAAPAVMAFNPTDATLLSARTGGYEAQPELGVLYDQLWVH